MNKTQLVKAISTILQEGRQEMLRHFSSDSCIAATKIAIDVLAHYHVLAKPLVARLMIFNPAFVRRIENGAAFPTSGEITKQWSEEDGSWCLGVGYGSAPTKWSGHLVAVLEEEGWLIDASLDQASRPNRNILVGPAVFDGVTEEFLRGERPLVKSINGSVLKYVAFPDEKSYNTSPNWHSPRPDELAVSEKIIEFIKEV